MKQSVTIRCVGEDVCVGRREDQRRVRARILTLLTRLFIHMSEPKAKAFPQQNTEYNYFHQSSKSRCGSLRIRMSQSGKIAVMARRISPALFTKHIWFLSN